jgi:hypothetical protein
MNVRMKGGLRFVLLLALEACGLAACGTTTIIQFLDTDASSDAASDAKSPPPGDGGRDGTNDGVASDGGVTTLASDQRQPLGIALSATEVYWSNVGVIDDGGVAVATGSIVRAPRGGGPSEILVPKLTEPQIVQYGSTGTTGDTLVWSVANDNVYEGAVSELILSTGKLKEAATAQEAPLGVAIDSENVYWVSSTGAGLFVQSANLATGTTTMLGLTEDDNEPGCIAVTPEGAELRALYVTGYAPTGPGGAVYEVPLTGGTMNVVWSTTVGRPYGITADAENVYWAVQDPVMGEIYQAKTGVPVDGGIPDGDTTPLDGGYTIGHAITLASGLPNAYFVAVDSSHAYYATNIAKGGVFEVPIGGGSVRTLAEGLDYPAGVAADETDDRVYFTTLTSIAAVRK